MTYSDGTSVTITNPLLVGVLTGTLTGGGTGSTAGTTGTTALKIGESNVLQEAGEGAFPFSYLDSSR